MNVFKVFLGLTFALGLATGESLVLAADEAGGTLATTELQLPEGWSMEDMQKCMMAGTPGEQHSLLAKDVGEWSGKCTMWMAPDAEPMTNDCTCKVTSILDGRFIKMEISGEMPGMGPYTGIGYYGYDNLKKKFVGNWLDNMNTAIMNGEGEATADGKKFSWTYQVMCPITGKETTMREIDTWTGPNSKTMEMYGEDPKSGKEFQSMLIELTRN